MKAYQGKGVFSSIAIGKIYCYKKKIYNTNKKSITDTALEIKKFEKAKNIAIEQLNMLYENSIKEIGIDDAEIFNIHKLMLEDEDFCSNIKHIITSEKLNCEYAIHKTCQSFVKLFKNMDDEYMQGRAADVKDISKRLLDCINKENNSIINFKEPIILFADDLSPSQTIQLDKTKILAIATKKGSTNSHTAILAKTMGIPAIIGLGNIEDCNGKLGIVDGLTGLFIVSPNKKTLQTYHDELDKKENEMLLKHKLIGLPSVTKDGKSIRVFANIGDISDTKYVLDNDAEGIGLFRSEFLFLKQNRYPTEEEQFLAYKYVLEKMHGKQVVIRTLDIGADKKVDYFKLPQEENPALGYRAIRICLRRPKIFKTQLRAIYRASAFGNINILFPMIISVDEIKKIKIIIKEVKTELKENKIAFNQNTKIGIMIETPASALISDLLAKEVDFFSVGTNDLTQYTLAIDRQNYKLGNFLDIHHPAIIKLIDMSCKNAHKNGIWIGICGELGADLELTEHFLRIGIDELSVSPCKVLNLREKIRNIDLSK